MYTIPSHLLLLHERRKKLSSNPKFMDNYFYRLEEQFIRPVFSKSQHVQKLANEWTSLASKTQLKHQMRDFFEHYADKYSLNLAGHTQTRFQYTRASSNGYPCYYSFEKNAVFMNEHRIDAALDNKKAAIWLIYALIHEIAHGLTDRWFFNGDGHCHNFLHVLMILLKDASKSSMAAVYQRRVLHQNGQMVNFDEYCMADGYFQRSPARYLSIFHCNNIESAIGILNSRYSCELKLKMTSVKTDDDTEWREVPDFDSQKQVTQSFVINLGQIFHDYEIVITKINHGVQVTIYKARDFIEFSHRCYLQSLDELLKSKT